MNQRGPNGIQEAHGCESDAHRVYRRRPRKIRHDDAAAAARQFQLFGKPKPITCPYWVTMDLGASLRKRR
jgi:hypothetical protein